MNGDQNVDQLFCQSKKRFNIENLLQRSSQGHVHLPRMHNRRISRIVNVFLIILLFGAGCHVPEGERVEIVLPDDEVLFVEVARTQKETEQGLSGREEIGDGMLFCFDDDEIRNFWMYDMKVPLDVAWIRDDVVVGIQSDIQIMTGDIFGEINGDFVHADSTWTTFSSPEPADSVLEMPVGYISNYNFEVGMNIGVNNVCNL